MKLYLDVADAYIKLSSTFNTLSTADKTDLSKLEKRKSDFEIILI
jgi:hypothetical protein